MSILSLALLGLLQGLTEFLPISSDGHLSLALLTLPSLGEGALPLQTVLHAGTLAVVIVWFRRDLLALLAEGIALLRGGRSNPTGLLAPVLVGSVPTAFVGLALKGTVEEALGSQVVILTCLAATAALLVLSDRVRGEGRDVVTWRQALLVGAAQGAAVLPGLSRSGATITTAVLLGIGRERAFTYSFVLSVPAVVGALLIEGGHASLPAGWPVGVAAAGVTGLGALALLRPLVRKAKLSIFAVYLALLIVAAALLGRP